MKKLLLTVMLLFVVVFSGFGVDGDAMISSAFSYLFYFSFKTIDDGF